VNDERVVDWAELAARRERWLRVGSGHGKALPARLALHAQANLAEFTDYCIGSAHGPVSASLIASAVAMAFFGPPGLPPPELWRTYVDVHRQLAAKAPDPRTMNAFDLMLAFGCGWGRAVVRDGGPWWGRWEVAYPAMINQVGASLLASNRLLANQFPQFALTSDDLLELPGDFAVSLLGSCDCGHHRRECQRRCGRECCFAPHDLGSWDPLTCHLRPFVDQAVRGTATGQILGGAFAESLTYRELERQGRILRRRVEFKQCPGCGQLFDEATCPTPGCEPPEGVSVPQMVRPNWLILPEHEGGNYREMVRWVCAVCSSVYPIRFDLAAPVVGDPCPVCDWTPPSGTPPRRITLWVRRPPDSPPVGHSGAGGADGGDPYDPRAEEVDDT